MALKQPVRTAAPGRLKLRIELIPKPLWEQNLRSSDGLGKFRWDKLRQTLIETNGARCAICGGTKKLRGLGVSGEEDRWDCRAFESRDCLH